MSPLYHSLSLWLLQIEERAVGRAGGVASAEMERELARLRERAEEEERLFARVPLKRDERKRLKALRRQQHSRWVFCPRT